MGTFILYLMENADTIKVGPDIIYEMANSIYISVCNWNNLIYTQPRDQIFQVIGV